MVSGPGDEICCKDTHSPVIGANGPAVPEFLELVPNATVIPRAGEINAYDNANFVTALEATGKKHVIVAGILTDVCKLYFLVTDCLDRGITVLT